MSKHHHQSREQQINNRALGEEQLRQDKMFYQKNEPIKPGNIPIKAAIKQNLIQERAYQIHSEKGGSPFDNWLEAEQSLNNNDYEYSDLNDKKAPLLFQKTNVKPAKVDLYR